MQRLLRIAFALVAAAVMMAGCKQSTETTTTASGTEAPAVTATPPAAVEPPPAVETAGSPAPAEATETTSAPPAPATTAATATAKPPVAATELTEASIQRIAPEEAKTEVDSGQAIVVDVRGLPYFTSHIQGALNIPENQIRFRTGELPRDKRIILYCT